LRRHTKFESRARSDHISFCSSGGAPLTQSHPISSQWGYSWCSVHTFWCSSHSLVGGNDGLGRSTIWSQKALIERERIFCALFRNGMATGGGEWWLSSVSGDTEWRWSESDDQIETIHRELRIERSC
jgi:hypothetical protein